MALVGAALAASLEANALNVTSASLPPNFNRSAAGQVHAALGETIVLAVGQSATIRAESVNIRFDRVVEDSRCPVGVTCVWEGDAVVRLVVVQGATTATVDLHLNATASRERVEGRYKIRLVDLQPQPTGAKPIETTAYRAHVMLTRTS